MSGVAAGSVAERGAAPGAGAAGAERPPVDGCHILVVDDTDMNRSVIGAVLSTAGFHDLAFAKDGFEALERVGARPPDLMLLDLMMPGMDGFEVCERLRADPVHADLPVLVQTALSGSDDRNRAFAVGATDLICKPLDRAELIARVRIHLENRLLIRDLRAYRARVEGELAMARALYDHLLPTPDDRAALRASSGVRVLADTVLSTDLGGGIWGVLPIDGRRFGVYLLDMGGRGVAAALNAFGIHTAIQELAGLAAEPAAFLDALNARAAGLLEPGERAAVLYGVADPVAGEFRHAAAGAAAPRLWGGTGAGVVADGAPGPAIGTAPDTRYTEHALPWPAGTALVLRSCAGGGDEGGRGGGGGPLEAVVERMLAAPEPAEDRFADLAQGLRTALAADGAGRDHTLVWLDRSD